MNNLTSPSLRPTPPKFDEAGRIPSNFMQPAFIRSSSVLDFLKYTGPTQTEQRNAGQTAAIN